MTEVHVRKVLDEIYERTTGETMRIPTVSDFLNDRLAAKVLIKGGSTVRS